MANLKPSPVRDAYTLYPAPNAKEFWATARIGSHKLMCLTPTVFSEGVIFRTKSALKAAYQYFKITKTGYSEVSSEAFETFIASATPPVAKSDAKIVSSDSPDAAKPVDISDMPKLAKSVQGVDASEAENVKEVSWSPITAGHKLPGLDLQLKPNLVVEFKCQACGHLHQITSYSASAPVTMQVAQTTTVAESAPSEAPAAAPVEATPAPVTEKAAKPSKAKASKEAKTEAAPASEPKAALTGLYSSESALVYVASKGADLSMSDIEAVETLIRGNAAPSKDLLDRLRSSKLLVVAKDDGKVIGCMGLQAKSVEYITNTNTKAGTTLPTDALEICWINVVVDRKGAARDGVIVNMFDTLKSSKANNPELAGKALYAVYNVGNVLGYEAMALLGMRKHDREHKGITKPAQVFLG